MALFGDEIAIPDHRIAPQIRRHRAGRRPGKGILGRVGRRHQQSRKRVANFGRALQGHPKRFHHANFFTRFLKCSQWLGL